MEFALIAACLGTYLCRAVGVRLSGQIDTESEIFKWLSAVTYAMVAALSIRLVALPVGLLAEVPLYIRLAICAVSLGVMISSPTKRLVPALLAGTGLMLCWGFIG